MIAAVLAAALAASADAPACPALLDVRETPAPPAGWRDWSASGGSAHRLAGVGFAEGDPDRRVILAPDSQGRRGDRYDFTAAAETVWMLCTYSQTSRGLARQTELRGKVCTVTGGGATGEPPAVTCGGSAGGRRR